MGPRSGLFALTCLVLLSFCAQSGHRIRAAQVKYTDETTAHGSPWQRIEDRATQENPSDGNSVRALIDEVLDSPHFFGRIPPIMREIVGQRLEQAEVNYKLGRSPGMPEKVLVEIANTLVNKFALPDYARTTLHQVDVLRFRMELSSPVFMKTASPMSEDTGTHSDNAELSPAQAAHILLVLIDAKLVDPEYQVPPDEWEKNQYKATMDQLLKYKQLKDSGQLATTQRQGRLVVRTADHDLRSVVSRAVSQMSLTDGLDLVDQAFEMAGIRK